MARQSKSAQRFFFPTPIAVSPFNTQDCFSMFLQAEKKVFCFKCNASRSSAHPEGTPHLCSCTCNNPPPLPPASPCTLLTPRGMHVQSFFLSAPATLTPPHPPSTGRPSVAAAPSRRSVELNRQPGGREENEGGSFPKPNEGIKMQKEASWPLQGEGDGMSGRRLDHPECWKLVIGLYLIPPPEK